MKKIRFLLAVFTCCSLQFQANGQHTTLSKKENIVYGMVSGTALLLDIYWPVKSNHKAILYIPGSAWGFPYGRHYDQVPLKADVTLDSNYTGKWVQGLAQKGYTVFVINHRFAPRNQFREIIADCRRAVRFIRANAKEYEIDPGHIGAMGHSSGGNLASMLGVSDTTIATAKSAVDRVSSKVQAVVTLAAPFNLADMNRFGDTMIINNYLLSAIASYMGHLPEMKQGEFILTGDYSEASPVTQVTTDDAPCLIYYSDNDPLIPVRHAEEMYKKLEQASVPAKIVVSPRQDHNPLPDMDEVCKWFEKYLK